MTMLSINTNVGALQAARSSYSVNKSMEQSMERLASGKRVNGAADDAAGLAIATRLNAEINGINQGIRNASDAQGMLAVAEGALEQVHALLLRMRELAVQSANETNSSADRNQLQTEVAQLEAEINELRMIPHGQELRFLLVGSHRVQRFKSVLEIPILFRYQYPLLNLYQLLGKVV